MLRRVAVGLTFAAVCSACSTIGGQTETIRILTHETFNLPVESLEAYTERTGVRVAVIREPDPQAVVELLSRTAENPIADVVVGIDSLSIARVVRERLVLPHRAIEADRLDPTFVIDDDQLTPISHLDVCLNVDLTAYRPPPPTPEELAEQQAIRAADVAEAEANGEEPPEIPIDPALSLPNPPTSLLALTEPIYFGDLVVPDPETDRLGQYFAVALQHRFGDGSITADGAVNEAWTTVLDRLVRNGMAIVPTWRDAYFGSFSQGNAAGEHSVVLASAQMPAVTARLRFEPPEILETAVIDDGCLRVVSYAGVVAGTREQRSAGRFIDQMITPEFQFNLGDDLGSRPARTDLVIPELIEQYGTDVEALLIDPVGDSADLAEWVGIFGLVVEDARQPIVVEDDPGTEPTADG